MNTTLADFIWKNADDLWGPFKHVEFGKIILPFTLLRRLECVLEPTREQVCQTVTSLKDTGIDIDVVLRTQTGYRSTTPRTTNSAASARRGRGRTSRTTSQASRTTPG